MPLRTYTLKDKGDLLLSGIGVGQAIAAGKVQALMDPNDRESFQPGSIQVTREIDLDWVPNMLKLLASSRRQEEVSLAKIPTKAQIMLDVATSSSALA